MPGTIFDTTPGDEFVVAIPRARVVVVPVPDQPAGALPAVPTSGQIWPRAKTIVNTPPAASWTRTAVTYTTGLLAAAEQEKGLIELAPGYRLYDIACSGPARVRLYVSASQRDVDAGRLISTVPTGDHGVVLDFLAATGFLAMDVLPQAYGYDDKPTPDGLIPILIDNTHTGPQSISVTLTYLRTE